MRSDKKFLSVGIIVFFSTFSEVRAVYGQKCPYTGDKDQKISIYQKRDSACTADVIRRMKADEAYCGAPTITNITRDNYTPEVRKCMIPRVQKTSDDLAACTEARMEGLRETWEICRRGRMKDSATASDLGKNRNAGSTETQSKKEAINGRMKPAHGNDGNCTALDGNGRPCLSGPAMDRTFRYTIKGKDVYLLTAEWKNNCKTGKSISVEYSRREGARIQEGEIYVSPGGKPERVSCLSDTCARPVDSYAEICR